MYVTDAQQFVVQSFLYAPYGEIISEYNTHAMGEAFPKYSFNAKELDEETGMYYFEARYYAPPMFTSRDPHFEKYPNFSPYTYCYNNPLKYVDPTGKDGEITIDEENKTIFVRANFYYNSSQLEQSKKYNIKNGFQDALDAWSNDIKTALTTMGFDGYTVNIQFEWKEVDIGNATGEDAIKIIQSAANAGPIGNSIVHDEMVSDAAIVSGSKHLSANMIKAGHDKYVFFGINGTATHEIGHFLGLRDRYSSSNSEHAPYIKGDLMSSDLYRDNAVTPFIRVMNYNNLTPGTSKSVLINKNNKEAK